MPIVQSKLKTGTLTLGATPGTDFACQATSVKLTPSYEDDGDNVETLCGEALSPGKKESWTINGTSIQDFDDPMGFVQYCFDNATQIVDFSWCPATGVSPTYSGKCTIVAVEIGGDVNTRITTDWEFAVEGKPTLTPVAPLEDADADADADADIEAA